MCLLSTNSYQRLYAGRVIFPGPLSQCLGGGRAFETRLGIYIRLCLNVRILYIHMWLGGSAADAALIKWCDFLDDECVSVWQNVMMCAI